MEVTPSVRLLSPIGEGGMGAVWLADHSGLNTRVVVKFMLDGLDSSTSARTRFKREAEAASQVKSPHVVQTFDYGVTAVGVPFIVMEHLEGRDLGAELAARGALDPATVVSIVTQVAKALSKAHAAGLLHRDIKPANIFLCHGETADELFVKLLDFGIAKTHAAAGEPELDGQTKTGQVVGTPFYMSPEQVTAQKVVDARSDLWSLGIVAFEALTGQRPYDGPSFGALAVKIATGAQPKPSHENPSLPPSVDAWFAQACAREPEARFASARELADRLRAAFEGVVSLPPVASGGAISDSRPISSGSRPTKPSAGADDTDRPSFVLASTVQTDDPTGDPSALARSEPGRSVVATADRTDDARASGRPTTRGKVVVPVVALAVVALALAAGWKAKEHSDPGPLPSSNAATSLAPIASAVPAVSVATVAVPASAPVAAPPSASSSAQPSPSTSVAPRAPLVVPTVLVRSSAAAASVKPPPSAAPRPSATVHDDPLF